MTLDGLSPVVYLILGLVAVAPLIWFAEKCSSKTRTRLLGRCLIIAALVYPLMALLRGQLQHLPIEVLGVAIYGSAYWLATKVHTVFLAFGWAGHTLWDALVHLFGPIQGVVPPWYAYACLSFDLVVAVYLLMRMKKV